MTGPTPGGCRGSGRQGGARQRAPVTPWALTARLAGRWQVGNFPRPPATLARLPAGSGPSRSRSAPAGGGVLTSAVHSRSESARVVLCRDQVCWCHAPNGIRDGGASVDDLRVSAWKRYGKDRLYVNTLTNTLTGETVGWQDRRTGEVHIEIEALGPAARAALAAYHRLHPLAAASSAPASPVLPTAEPTPPPIPPDFDLARHKPGIPCGTSQHVRPASSPDYSGG